MRKPVEHLALTWGDNGVRVMAWYPVTVEGLRVAASDVEHHGPPTYARVEERVASTGGANSEEPP